MNKPSDKFFERGTMFGAMDRIAGVPRRDKPSIVTPLIDEIHADAQAVVAMEIVCGDGTVNTVKLREDHAVACAREVLRGYDVGYAKPSA